MKRELDHFFKEIREGRFRFSDRAYIFLFCLLLSTFFWFLSALSEIYTTDLQSPLKYSGLADDFILTKEPPKSIKLQVRGNGFELLGEQMSLDRKSIQIDLGEARKASGNRYYILSEKLQDLIEDQLDPDLELISVSPDSLFLQTQERISKTVPIRLKSKITLEDGYQQRGEIGLVPKEVKVSGPKSVIDTLSFVQSMPLNRNDLKDTLLEELKLKQIQGITGLIMKPETVHVMIPVEKYTEKTVEVPIEVKTNLSVNIKTFPDKVEAKLLVPLSEYKNLKASILDAQVEYAEENREQKKLKVKINGLPDHVKLIRLEPERVEYIIRK